MLPTSSTGRAAALAAAARPKSHAGQPVPVRQRLVASLPSREMSRFLAACVAWYMASALSSNTSKALLSAPRRKSEAAALPPLSAPFPYPVSLTLIQFLFVHIFCAMAASRTLTSFVGLRTPLAKLQQPSWNRIREMGTLSIFNAVGHALSSLAISRVPVSTVHTIKALTPLFTVLSFRLLFAVVYPFRTYASLCPLTLGVMMACTGMAFNADDLLGLMAALASTLVFVANNILSKKVLTKGGHGPGEGEKTDKYSVLYYSSGISCVIMLPMVMYADLPSMLAAAVTPDDPLQKERLHDHLLETSTGVRGMQVTALGVMWGLTVNGIVHFAQNVIAFSVLGLVSPVTYSIAGLCKRIFVIVVAIIWFGQSVSTLQWLGIFLTFLGLYLYNDAKTRSSNAAGDAKIRRDDRQTLPVTRGDLPTEHIALPRLHHAAPLSNLALGHNPESSAGPSRPSQGHGTAFVSSGQHANARHGPSHSAGFKDFIGAANASDPRRSIPTPPPSGQNSDDGADGNAGRKRD